MPIISKITQGPLKTNFTILTLVLVGVIFCLNLAAFTLNPKGKSCMKSNAAWAAAVAYFFTTSLLFGVMLKRILLSSRFGYKCVGLFRGPRTIVFDMKLRLAGFVLHCFTCIAIVIWIIFQAKQNNTFSCGADKDLTAVLAVSVTTFAVLFFSEVLIGSQGEEVAHTVQTVKNALEEEVEIEEQPRIGHYWAVGCLLVVCILVGINVNDSHYAGDKYATGSTLILALAALAMLSCDYVSHANTIDMFFLGDHWVEHALMFLVVVAQCVIFIQQVSHSTGETRRVMIASTCFALGAFPGSIGIDRVFGQPNKSNRKVNKTFCEAELHPSSSGMTYDRLSKSNTNKLQLQFV